MNINDNYINDMLFENENNDYEAYERIGEPAKTLKPVTVNKDFPKEKTVEIMNKYNKGKELVSLYEDILKEILGVDVITEKDTFRKDIPEDRKEEFLCAAKEYRAGVRMISEAKTDLIANLDKFVLWMINTKFKTFTRYTEDLKNEGVVGILKGMDSYDPNKSCATTFFYLYILHEMTEFVNRYVNKTTSHYSENIVRIKRVLNKYEQQGRSINVVEISQETGISPETIIQSIKVMHAANEVHYDADYLEGKLTTYGDSPETICMHGEDNKLIYEVMKKILTEEEMNVLVMKYGLDGSEPMSYKKIFETTGIPIDRLRKLFNSAIRKLRTNRSLAKNFKNNLREESILNKGTVGIVPIDIGEALADDIEDLPL